MKNHILRAMLRFRHDAEAVTAIEYALLASLLAVAVIAGALAIAPSLSNTFNSATTGLGGTAAAAPSPSFPDLGPSKPCTNGDSGNCVTNSGGDQIPTPPGYNH